MADIFLIDFDNTISLNDSTAVLMKRHNPEGLKIIREKYKNKELTIMGYIKSCLESLNITKDEYLKTLGEDVKVDETFKQFTESGLDYRIVSAGSRLNVLGSLDSKGIHIDEKLILSNEVSFKDNNIIKLEFPYEDKEKLLGVDKKSLVLEYKNNGDRVFFVGDGPSDYEAVKVADYVFVRTGTRLINYCKDNNIIFYEFTDFVDLLKQYKEEFCGTK